MSSSLTDIVSIIAIVLVFGGSIFIHELGHFLAARLRGLKVTRFSIGFGPKIFGWTGKDGCQYRLSLLPLGGYVALPQLADMEEIEGSDLSKEEIAKLKPATFTDKVIVSAAGAFFNVLLAILMAVLVYFIGIAVPSDYNTKVVGYVGDNNNYAENMQEKGEPYLQEGDTVLAVDSSEISKFSDITTKVALGSNRDKSGKPMAIFTVLRDGKKLDIKTFPTLQKTNAKTGDEIRMLDIYPQSKVIINNITKASPAEKAGLKAGDELLKLNGEKLNSLPSLIEKLNKSEGECSLSFMRNGEEMELSITPKKIARTKASCEIFPAKENESALLGLICTNKKSTDITENEVGTLKVLTRNDKHYLLKNINIGDTLYQVGDTKVSSLAELNNIINSMSEDEPIMLKFINSSSVMEDIVLERNSYSRLNPPQRVAMIGCVFSQNKSVEHPSITEQISNSFSLTYEGIASLFNTKSDIGIDHMSGPVGISRVIYKISKEDVALLLAFTLLLNINLAILNMLPIPILDGGHIVMACIEKITGKPIQRSLIIKVTQSIFALAFIVLMVYIIYMDTQRWQGDLRQEDIASIQKQYYLTDLSFENNE